jgi:hypothetical protein
LRRWAQYRARAGSSGDAAPVTGTCRSMAVQENLTRQVPLSRSPNTQRSFLNVLNLPKYRPTIQRFGYLGEPPVGRHELTVRAGCHVAAGQHAGKHVRRSLELQGQDVGESAFFGFDDGVGVMGDRPALHGVGLMDVAQVAHHPGRAGPSRQGQARNRCRAAARPLAGDRRPRPGQVPGCMPARRRPVVT